MIDELKPNWYVAQTHPNGESKAVAQLERQGFETYLPRYLKTTRHARRTRVQLAPLFPRYVFVRFDMEKQCWRVVNSTSGVAHLVGHGDRPSPVLGGVIDGLKQQEGVGGVFELKTAAQRFRAGDAIRVSLGVFEACYGFFEAQADRDRVAILLDLLGRKARVVLNAAAIELA